MFLWQKKLKPIFFNFSQYSSVFSRISPSLTFFSGVFFCWFCHPHVLKIIEPTHNFKHVRFYGLLECHAFSSV